MELIFLLLCNPAVLLTFTPALCLLVGGLCVSILVSVLFWLALLWVSGTVQLHYFWQPHRAVPYVSLVVTERLALGARALPQTVLSALLWTRVSLLSVHAPETSCYLTMLGTGTLLLSGMHFGPCCPLISSMLVIALCNNFLPCSCALPLACLELWHPTFGPKRPISEPVIRRRLRRKTAPSGAYAERRPVTPTALASYDGYLTEQMRKDPSITLAELRKQLYADKQLHCEHQDLKKWMQYYAERREEQMPSIPTGSGTPASSSANAEITICSVQDLQPCTSHFKELF